jgi:hypothetical protein
MRNSPCYKCERRKATDAYNCHTDCPDYAEYRKEIDEMKKARGENIYISYMINSVQKKRKKKNEKNRT